MKLKEILKLVSDTANEFGISKPYIVGGIPRDKILNRSNLLEDIDITTGDQSIKNLSKEVSLKLKKMGVPHEYQIMNDGHSKIELPNIKLDFSSNFNTPNIENLLKSAKIENPTEMQKELYSRDFTVNSFLMDLNLVDIDDQTGLATEGIREKVLDTNLKPELTLGIDPKRIVRALYLAAKLDFDLSDRVKDWIKANKSKLNAPSAYYVSKKMKKGFDYNPEKMKSVLDELELWPYVPVTKELMPYVSGNIKSASVKLAKKKKKKKDKKRVDRDVRPTLFYDNYDYTTGDEKSGPGGGFYMNMDKYKSTRDFIEKKRKQRKQRKDAMIKILSEASNIESLIDNFKKRIEG